VKELRTVSVLILFTEEINHYKEWVVCDTMIFTPAFSKLQLLAQNVLGGESIEITQANIFIKQKNLAKRKSEIGSVFIGY
jgi:hypothetical protein